MVNFRRAVQLGRKARSLANLKPSRVGLVDTLKMVSNFERLRLPPKQAEGIKHSVMKTLDDRLRYMSDRFASTVEQDKFKEMVTVKLENLKIKVLSSMEDKSKTVDRELDKMVRESKDDIRAFETECNNIMDNERLEFLCSLDSVRSKMIKSFIFSVFVVSLVACSLVLLWSYVDTSVWKILRP